jgi:hypothetical protein
MRLDYASVYTPLLACLAAGWSLFARPPAADSRRDALLITVTVIAAAFYLKGLVRPSPVHLIASVISSLVVLGVLVVRSRGEGGALRITVAVLALVSFASAAFAAWIGISERLDSRSRWRRASPPSPRARARSRGAARRPSSPRSSACCSIPTRAGGGDGR